MMKIMKVLKSTLGAAIVAGAISFAAAPAANAGVFVSVGFAPPAIPVYEQPLAPGYGYIWTPGYWAYGPDGYYWIDGAWVEPPYGGALWTPGYWDFAVGGYFWHPGYWGRTVGYYGGINYGFGYFGTGFWGGYWNRGHFFYNTAYNHIGFHNGFVYNHPVAGFNGRPGGAAFARNAGAVNHGAESFRGNQAFNRGNSFAENRAPANAGAARTQTAPQARSFTGGANYGGGQAHSVPAGGGGHASFSGGGSHGGGGGHR